MSLSTEPTTTTNSLNIKNKEQVKGSMKISVQKSDLFQLLSKTQNIVEKRNTMPVLANVLLEAKNGRLKVYATDLEVSLTDDVEAEVEMAGQVAVNAKNLFEIVRELPDGSVKLSKAENNWLSIRQNKSSFNIIGISADEYPVFPAYSTRDFIKLQPELLSDMIGKTIFSVSNDETRYHLNGVYFEQHRTDEGVQYRMVATDGHRLSLVDRQIKTDAKPKNEGVIIPRKGLQEIGKLLGTSLSLVEMAIEGSQLIVRSGTTVLMIRLIEGKYPNYQQLIPQSLKKRALASRDELVSSLRRVSLLSNQKSKSVTLTLTPGVLQISSNNPEMGDAREEVEIRYTGDEVKIGFNAKYLLDILNSFSDEEVDLELNDHLSPGLIRPHNDSHYTCVVMPMRI